MNWLRSVGIALVTIVAYYVLTVIVFVKGYGYMEGRMFWTALLIQVPVLLLGAKWYFKAHTPSLLEGVRFALWVIGTGGALVIAYALYMCATQYHNVVPWRLLFTWKSLLFFAEIFAISLYAGGEFDGTHSKRT